MKTDEQYTILAASERLDKTLVELGKEIESLELGINERFGVCLSVATLQGIAKFLHEKAKVIAETQP